MPAPVRNDQRYMPGLDGLRALAVASVVAYHVDLGWAQGGQPVKTGHIALIITNRRRHVPRHQSA